MVHIALLDAKSTEWHSPPTLEVCVPGLVFGVPNFFPSRTFKNILFPVLTQSRPFKTGHCPSRLSPKNETGIPEFGKTIVKTYTITTREPSIYVTKFPYEEGYCWSIKVLIEINKKLPALQNMFLWEATRRKRESRETFESLFDKL